MHSIAKLDAPGPVRETGSRTEILPPREVRGSWENVQVSAVGKKRGGCGFVFVDVSFWATSSSGKEAIACAVDIQVMCLA
jgi:hypothetical protein